MTSPILWLWLIEQDEQGGYDTFDSAVVIASSSEEAAKIHPSTYTKEDEWPENGTWSSSPSGVTVTRLGPCTNLAFKEGGVVCSSCNAG